MTEESALPPALRLPGVSAYACDFTPDGDEFADIALPAHLASATRKRKAEFRAGRYCAMRALEAMGARPTVPPIGRDRAPVWPDGIVGSISHSAGYAIAVAADRQSYLGLGIDLEGIVPANDVPGLLPHVASQEEMERLSATFGPAAAFTLLFSGKEAIYKAIYPLVRRFVGFHEMSFIELGQGKLLFQPIGAIAQSLSGLDSLSVSFDQRADRILSMCSIPVAPGTPHAAPLLT